MEKLMIRNFIDTDAAALEQVIRETWNYDRFSPPQTAQRLARVYLYSCLLRQSFVRVAVMGGKSVGVIMGRDLRKKASGGFTWKAIGAQLSMLVHREDRKVIKVFSGIDSVDKQLLEECGRKYDGELCFFAVDSKCRGAGIGKRLFNEVKEYFKAQGVGSFYLYTDSSCNYGFYEHQGMKRCGERLLSVPIGIDNQMQFFLYEGETEKRLQ